MATVYEQLAPFIPGQTYQFPASVVDASDTDSFKANPTLATGDVTVSKDGGSKANIGSLPVAVDSDDELTVSLTSGETTGVTKYLIVHFADQTATKEWQDIKYILFPYQSVTVSDFDEASDTVTLAAATHTGAVVPTVTSVTNGVSLANDAITSAKFDETTAFPLKSADSGSTQVARVGADSDTLETLSDQMDDLAPASTALTSATWTDARAAKLDYLDASVDGIGAQVQAQLSAAGYEAGEMNFIITATYDETITDLTIPSNWSKMYYSVKEVGAEEDENAALLRILVTSGGAAGDGLQRVNGGAPADFSLAASNASLTVSQSAGTCAVVVDDSVTAIIAPGTYEYDVKVVEDDGTSFQLATDTATFARTATWATS